MLDILNEINWFYLGASWMLNLFDLLITYMVVTGLIGQRIKLTIRACLFTVIYAVIMGTFAFFDTGFLYQPMATVIMFFLIKWWTKPVTCIRNTADILLILFVSFLIVITLNFSAGTLLGMMRLSAVWHMLASYVTSLTTILILRYKLDFNKLFILVNNRVLFRLIFFILSMIIVALLAFFVFDVFDERLISALHLAFLSIGLIIAAGLVYTIKLAHLYTDTLPERYHDVDELLSILRNKAYQAISIEQLQHDIDIIIDLIGVKVQEPDQRSMSSNQAETTILATIESLKLNVTHRAEVVTRIRYQAVHEVIDDVQISYFLGILLKNAMQTLTKKPIYVDIFSSKSLVKIIVSNEMPEKTEKELRRMLQKGYSTKGKTGSGYGLAKLKKLIEAYQGEINIAQEYHLDEDANYIKVTITL